MSTKVDVFVDFVCPFCFLVENAIEKLIRDRDVEVRIRPFELRPDPTPTLRPEDSYLPRVWHASVYPMADCVGIPLTLPSISPQPRTEKTFMLLQLAEERGRSQEYSLAVYKAFFQSDRDIGNDDVLIEVAVSVGLDPRDAKEALNSEERRTRHRADQDYALNTVGITSVPGIVIGGQLLSGVPSAARLKNAVDTTVGNLGQPKEYQQASS